MIAGNSRICRNSPEGRVVLERTKSGFIVSEQSINMETQVWGQSITDYEVYVISKGGCFAVFSEPFDTDYVIMGRKKDYIERSLIGISLNGKEARNMAFNEAMRRAQNLAQTRRYLLDNRTQADQQL